MNDKEDSKFVGPLSAPDFSQPSIADIIRILDADDGMPVVPFVGAGLAVPYDLPEWTGFLLDYAKKTRCLVKVRKLLNSQQPDRYEAAAELIRLRKPTGLQQAIRNDLQRQLTPADLQIESAMLELTRFSIGAIITTNFDNVLESIFSQCASPFTKVHLGGSANVDDLPRFPRRRELLKLHGSAENRTSMVLTSTEYANHYCNQDGVLDVTKSLPSILAHCAASSVLLFLGCSLQNDRYLEILSLYGRKGDVPHFAILSKPRSQREILDRTDELLGKYNIQPVWFDHGQFDHIRLLLQYFRSQDIESIGDENGFSCEMTVSVPPNEALELQSKFKTLLLDNPQISQTDLGKIDIGRLTIFNIGNGILEIEAFPSFVGQREDSFARLTLKQRNVKYFFTPQGPGGVKIRFEPGQNSFRLVDCHSNQLIVRIDNV